MTSTSRKAFEAHIERMTGERPFMIGGTYNNVGWRKSWEDWQAAIQHARDVAVKACESRIMGDHNREDQEAQRCADAIKEALK